MNSIRSRNFFLKLVFSAAVFYTSVVGIDRLIYHFRFDLNNSPTDVVESEILSDYKISTENFDTTKYPPLISINQRYGRSDADLEAVKSETRKIGDLTVSQNKLFSTDGKLIYDATYTYDQFGRRTEAGANLKLESSSDETAVFLVGCSFLFGSGVNDDETPNHYLKQMIGNIPVINFSVGGAGPNDHLFDIRSPSIGRYRTPYKKAIVIYGFIPWHIQRSTCNTSCYFQNNYMLKKPRYIVDDRKNLVYIGLHEDAYDNKLIRLLLGNFNNFTRGNGLFVLPSDNSADSIELYLRLLQDLKAEFESRYRIVDFYHAFLHAPTSRQQLATIIPRLAEMNIKPVAFPYSELGVKGADLTIPLDGHPTPLAHYIFAEGMNSRLRQDHPELFNSGH